MHCAPDLLICSLLSPVGSFMAVVGHAPCATYPQQVIYDWWDDTEKTISKCSQCGLPVVLLFDANATVGSVLAPGIGGNRSAKYISHRTQAPWDLLNATVDFYRKAGVARRNMGLLLPWIGPRSFYPLA